MSEISNVVNQSSSTIADSKIASLRYNKTITAEIYKIVDLNTGEYKVKYLNNIFSVYSTNTEYTYKVGTNVYVEIPEGDFSNKKLIKATSSGSASTTSSEVSSNYQTTVIEKSPSLESFYTGIVLTKEGVVAGAPKDSTNPPGHQYLYNEIGGYSPSNAHLVFQQYASNYQTLQVSAEFKTELNSPHTKGNYGIELGFYAKIDGQDNVYEVLTYRLDCDSFNGSPYKLGNFTDQSSLFTINKDYIVGLKYIKLFQENFDYDKFYKNGEPIGDNTNTPNIFVQNVQIKFVDIQDLMNTPYYLNIVTPNGKYFNSSNSSLTLKAELINAGKNILNEDSCTCYWYRQNPAINPSSEAGYDKNGGYGWELLTSDTFGSLTVAKTAVPYTKKYKVVVVYQKKTVLSSEVELVNLDSSYNFTIEATTTSSGTTLQVKNSNGTVHKATWYVLKSDGTYEQLYNEGSTEAKVESISIRSYLVDSLFVFYCDVYDVAEENIIATLSWTLVKTDTVDVDVNTINVFYLGEDAFIYDANGDVSIDDSEQERVLYTTITGIKTTEIASVKWFIIQNNEETNISTNATNPTAPTNSMIKSAWADNTNYKLHFSIRQKFYVDYIENIVGLAITTISGKTYKFYKEITFLKDGDQGTNGSTYMMIIRPCDAEGNRITGLQPLVNCNNAWTRNVRLGCYIYYDGEIVTSSSTTYKWTCTNCTAATTTNKTCLIAGSNKNNPAAVEVQAVITDASNAQTILTAFYPIDTFICETGKDNLYSKFNISMLPSYAQYSSSGFDPIVSNKDLYFIYDNVKKISELSGGPSSLLTLKAKRDKDSVLIAQRLSPAAKFIFENNSIGYLNCEIDDNNYLVHPIIFYLNTYGNEAINGWDGTKVAIEDGYILAPQIGAGEKDFSNKFTGVIMGKDTTQGTNGLVGLYGYQHGISTFGLREDGTAFFGAANTGRIEIDGTTSVIRGGLDDASSHNMILNLTVDKDSSGNWDYTTKAIDIKDGNGNSAFYVDYNGQAYLSGTINASAGYIGGWKIQNGSISKGKTTLTSSGTLVCKEGQIGGWNIGETSLYSDSGVTVLSPENIKTNVFHINIQDGSSIVNTGNIGTMLGSDGSTTYNLGLETTHRTDGGDDSSIILNSARNISISAHGYEHGYEGSIYLLGKNLVTTIEAENQYGIAARFA